MEKKRGSGSKKKGIRGRGAKTGGRGGKKNGGVRQQKKTGFDDGEKKRRGGSRKKTGGATENNSPTSFFNSAAAVGTSARPCGWDPRGGSKKKLNSKVKNFPPNKISPNRSSSWLKESAENFPPNRNRRRKCWLKRLRIALVGYIKKPHSKINEYHLQYHIVPNIKFAVAGLEAVHPPAWPP